MAIVYSRIKWRCRRGTRELDALLEPYVKQYFLTASPAEQQQFEQLLTLSDPELSAYLHGQATPSEADVAQLIDKIRQAPKPD